MDPFDRPPSRSSRRYSMNNSSFALPTLPSLGHSSSFSSSRLPSPNDILSGNSGNDRFASSLDLPPLRGVPRSTSPLLSPSHRPGTGAGRSYSDFPSLPPLPPFPSSFSSSRNPNLPERTSGGRSFVHYPDLTGPIPSHRPNMRSRRTSSIGGSMDLDDLPLSTSSNRPSFLSRGSSTSISSGHAFPAPLSSSSTVFDLPPIPPLSSSSQRTSFSTRGMADLSLSPSSPYADRDSTIQNLSDGLGVSPSSVELNGVGTGPSSHLASLYSPTSAQVRNSSSHASKGIRKYSKRATFSSAQLTIMEALWNTDQYPSVDQVDECASATGLTAKQIRTWFGNTRQARLAGTRTEARLAGLPSSSSAGGAGGRARHSMMPPASSGFLGTSPPVGAGSHFPSLTGGGGSGRRSDFPSPFPPSSSLSSSLGRGSSMFPPLGDPFSSSLSGGGARPVSRSRRNSVVGLPSLYGSTSSSSSGSSFGEREYGGSGSYGL